ncbi:MAG: sialidase family protein [Candidatus Hydrogenedentes bacterium]|nr:sialidase family protein [Candidatus Hydrogenedentota bacterium]
MSRFIGLLTLSIFTCTTIAFAQIERNPERDNIETYRVFGPEHPGLYKHPASITELANGDLYIAYYGGADEYATDTAVYGSRQKKGDTLWTMPEVIADTPDHGDGNPVIWQAPDGLVWLFYNNIYGTTWSDGRVLAKISKDGAMTWSDSIVINFERGSMVRGQPIVLNSGEYLLPLYHETGGDTEMTASDTMSYFMRYNPKDKTWTESSRIKSANGNLQAQVVQIDDNYLIAYIRRGGNFLPTEHGYAIRSESRDGGHTWSEGVDTPFKNPNSALDFIKLKSGNLLMVYNDNMNERTPLTIAISTDNDKTWAHSRNILGGDNTFAYPYAIQRSDGKICIIYTTNARTTIMMSVFNESAIIESKW